MFSIIVSTGRVLRYVRVELSKGRVVHGPSCPITVPSTPHQVLCSPALTKLTNLRPPLSIRILGFFLLLSKVSARTDKTLSCRHGYCPSVKATEHEHRICSKLAGLQQSFNFGSSIIPHVAKFVGVGSTSYINFSWNFFSLLGSMGQISFHFSFRLASFLPVQPTSLLLHANCSDHPCVFLHCTELPLYHLSPLLLRRCPPSRCLCYYKP